MTRQRRTFTPEFKLQLVKLYENGKYRQMLVCVTRLRLIYVTRMSIFLY